MTDGSDERRDDPEAVPPSESSTGPTETPDEEGGAVAHRGGDHPAPPGSGREFARGQASEEVVDPEGDHPAPPGSGREFARGQASEEVVDPDDEHAAPEGSGKQFARGQADEDIVDPHGGDQH